ncbi:MAG: hypothetical protein KDA89_05600 [Planctomycetaceae bacterium]|nr:hypothetical protein [Planctomycetaceae bacterium]
MSTSPRKKEKNTGRPNGHDSARSETASAADRSESAPKSANAPSPVDATRLTARILKKLDQLEAGVAELSARSGGEENSQEANVSAAISEFRAATEAESRELTLRISEALANQNSAILEIAQSLKQLEHRISESSAAASSTTSAVREADEESDSDSPTVAQNALSDGAALSNNTWEEIRSAFLRDYDGPDSPADAPNSGRHRRRSDSEPTHGGVVAADAASVIPLPIQAEADEPLSDLPEVIDPHVLDSDQLREIVIAREGLMMNLVRRLQKRHRITPVLSSEQLDSIRTDLPDELIQSVELTLRGLNEQLRLGELELSLERARVSRQLATLELTREKLDATARALGLNLKDDGTLDGEVDPNLKRGSKGRRWLGAMGFGN